MPRASAIAAPLRNQTDPHAASVGKSRAAARRSRERRRSFLRERRRRRQPSEHRRERQRAIKHSAMREQQSPDKNVAKNTSDQSGLRSLLRRGEF
jgi:hypothetical protein